jgi:hypothetical protein
MRFLDLIISAGRRRLSSRTRFIHDGEVIPLYENFCFVLALFRQKTIESIVEGKDLLERLLAFQSKEGNFPLYMHDFPKCHDFQMGLKVAPILIQLLKGSMLGSLKGQIEELLSRILARGSDKSSLENRLRACRGEKISPIDTSNFAPSDWTDWLITAQLAGQTHFAIPYDPDLQMVFGPLNVQEKGEPKPHPVEWLLADGAYSPRLLKDHPHLLLAAPLLPITWEPSPIPSAGYRQFWKGSTIHSLVAETLEFRLPDGVEMGRGDLIECALFADISKETEILVNGKRATSFQLEDVLTLKTPQKEMRLQFHLQEGEGMFCGHIMRGNRPSQMCKEGAYDWKIALRTLRRSTPCLVTVAVSTAA